MTKFIFILGLISATTSWAQLPSKDFSPEQVKFSFLSTEGDMWSNCTHKRTTPAHGWKVNCGAAEFNLHLFMIEHPRENDTTYELHYWADEVSILSETHTQSTWITIDGVAKAKRVVSYLGFQKDSTQLRFEVNLNRATAK